MNGGMGLYWSLQHVKSLLPPHLVARLHEAYVNPYREPDTEDSYKAFDARNGNIIMNMPIKETTVRMSRRKLRALCVRGIDVEVSQRFILATQLGSDQTWCLSQWITLTTLAL